MYDIIPRNMGLIKNAPLSRQMKLSNNCEMDRYGRCRKKVERTYSRINRSRGTEFFVRKSDPRKYLNWLRSLRNKRSSQRNRG